MRSKSKAAQWEQALTLFEAMLTARTDPNVMSYTVPLSVAYRFFQHVKNLNRCLNTHQLGVTKNLESSQAHLDSLRAKPPRFRDFFMAEMAAERYSNSDEN